MRMNFSTGGHVNKLPDKSSILCENRPSDGAVFIVLYALIVEFRSAWKLSVFEKRLKIFFL